MNTIGALVGGVIAGLIGAAIWAAVSYFTGYEIGWLAWGIGALVGFGVALGTNKQGGMTAGGTAAIIALASIAGGKYAAIRMEVGNWMGDDLIVSNIADVIIAEQEERTGNSVPMPMIDFEDADSVSDYYPPSIWSQAEAQWQGMSEAEQARLRMLPPLANPQFLTVWIADEVVGEREQAGEQVDWPPGWDIESAWREPHYPPDVWAEAIARWDTMTPAEQQDFEGGVIEIAGADFREIEAMMTEQGFIGSLSPFDLLWAALAVITAFQLGRGGTQSTEPARGEVIGGLPGDPGGAAPPAPAAEQPPDSPQSPGPPGP